MKTFLIVAVIVIVVAGSAVSAYVYVRRPAEAAVSTVAVSLGDVIQVVGATGTVEAVTTVDVGTQVTGVVNQMYADFNAIVKKGQLLATIDPATIQATIQSDRANVEGAQANAARLEIVRDASRINLTRAEDLSRRQLISQQDLETVQVEVKTNEAAIKSQAATVRQTQAKLSQDLINLGYTNIYAPIDGIVINRRVDIGQTVVSNNVATSLFQIAADLTRMQVKASVDESDVGLVRPGQPTTFSVDAYPNKEFAGVVAQIRLQPVVTQNVVTYTTIIDVPNPNLELKPGMTATVKIQIARREGTLGVATAALRFAPTREIFTALGIPVPPTLAVQRRGTAKAGDRAPASGNGVSGLTERGTGDRPAGETARVSKGIANQGATTIDALFGALTFPESPGRVWVYAVDPSSKAKSLKAISVRTGISDGSLVELVDAGGLTQGQLVVTGVDTGRLSAARPRTNPLMPTGRPAGGGR